MLEIVHVEETRAGAEKPAARITPNREGSVLV